MRKSDKNHLTLEGIVTNAACFTLTGHKRFLLTSFLLKAQRGAGFQLLSPLLVRFIAHRNERRDYVNRFLFKSGALQQAAMQYSSSLWRRSPVDHPSCGTSSITFSQLICTSSTLHPKPPVTQSKKVIASFSSSLLFFDSW